MNLHFFTKSFLRKNYILFPLQKTIEHYDTIFRQLNTKFKLTIFCKEVPLNILSVANMSEKSSFGMPRKSPSSSSEKWKILSKNDRDNFDNTYKKAFSYLEERSPKSKKFVIGCTPPINPSPIDVFFTSLGESSQNYASVLIWWL